MCVWVSMRWYYFAMIVIIIVIIIILMLFVCFRRWLADLVFFGFSRKNSIKIEIFFGNYIERVWLLAYAFRLDIGRECFSF